ncbi:MAG: hypothetical protein K2J99_06180, partial [Lachnospiraceae bacterium]|nr:hypothetical protein [Lachnospiraceae bacterium]
MSSSEEYLDSLLKSLTEGDSQTSADSSEAPEFDMADDMQDNTENVGSEPGEQDMAMSMNELEAMFASMGEITPEEMGTDEAPSDDSELSEDLLAGEMTLEGEEITEEMLEEPMDDFVLDDSLMPEELE